MEKAILIKHPAKFLLVSIALLSMLAAMPAYAGSSRDDSGHGDRFAPDYSRDRWRPSYRYEGTSLGGSVQYVSGYYYKISDPKTEFYSDQFPYVISDFYDIKGVRQFQVKYELSGPENAVKYSPEYRPCGQYWRETHYWTNFHKLKAGSYTLSVYLKVNNGSWNRIDQDYFKVKNRRHQYSQCRNGFNKCNSGNGYRDHSESYMDRRNNGRTQDGFDDSEDRYRLDDNGDLSDDDTFAYYED